LDGEVDISDYYEGEVSEWGAPMTHDGTLPTTQVFYVDAVRDITGDGWEYMEKTRQIDWVIIPLRTTRHGNY